MPVETYIPIIVAVVQVIKQFNIDQKWMPVISIVLGIAFAGFSLGFEPGNIIKGIIWGLSAVGLFETGKTAGRKLGWGRKHT